MSIHIKSNLCNFEAYRFRFSRIQSMISTPSLRTRIVFEMNFHFAWWLLMAHTSGVTIDSANFSILNNVSISCRKKHIHMRFSVLPAIINYIRKQTPIFHFASHSGNDSTTFSISVPHHPPTWSNKQCIFQNSHRLRQMPGPRCNHWPIPDTFLKSKYDCWHRNMLIVIARSDSALLTSKT